MQSPPDFDLEDVCLILSRTPAALDAWLRGLPEAWIFCNEGRESWSPFDILGHLIHGERTDWIPRLRIILEHGEKQPFEPFDRFAQFRSSVGKTLDDLLGDFAFRRRQNVETLRALRLTREQLDLRGMHPELGTVTARELLATWVAHDLSHIRQIARVMAKHYADEAGPWTKYLPVLER